MSTLRVLSILCTSSLILGACAGDDGNDPSGVNDNTGGETTNTGGTDSFGSGGTGGTGAISTGGTSQGTGGDGTGGDDSDGSGGDGTGGWTPGYIPKGNPPVKSAGCGKPTTITTGEYKITSSNQERVYYVDLPSDYDPNVPYRLFYTSHWIGSNYQAVRDQNFYFLKPLIEADGERAIFVAPSSDGATWQQKDHALFDDILAFLNENTASTPRASSPPASASAA